ncbi:patatin-like phospholipase family protein [Pseudoxanthomonas helianthi]|uniref:Patatin-like phospholipase family protein n=1 Tax=Pseudoxanthomonas helianthi TaxID=1453541 RepID=A0A940X8V5_9GAMM|nr:CBASS cGAMP-activated phospholipase [Pseudoxanthomonas helianthi]MBP3985573.1 patatin-like phospholipase family protein [Pseudoxanthomonas helianthi]
MVGEDAPFHILALTGGGFRGLYSARVLQEIEQAAGRPIGQCFDLIAGTSIGGILALAVAFEKPMSEVVEVFSEAGRKIFPQRGVLAGLFSSKYDAAPLRDVIGSILPENATLSDARHALVIPALNLTAGKQQIFKTKHNAEWTRDLRYLARDVAIATAAAPIYFPIASLDNQLFADGGLFANAPDLVALHEAGKFFGKSESQVRMLSVGTLSSTYAVPASAKRKRGVIDWLRPTEFPLIQVILSAQQQFSTQIVEHRLGDRYMRIDGQPADAVMRDVGLDKTGESSRQVLLGLAAKHVTDVIGTEPFKRLLTHIPGNWLHKGE